MVFAKSITRYLLPRVPIPLEEQTEREATERNCRGKKWKKNAKGAKDRKKTYSYQRRTLVKRLKKGKKFIKRNPLDSDDISFVNESDLLSA